MEHARDFDRAVIVNPVKNQIRSDWETHYAILDFLSMPANVRMVGN